MPDCSPGCELCGMCVGKVFSVFSPELGRKIKGAGGVLGLNGNAKPSVRH